MLTVVAERALEDREKRRERETGIDRPRSRSPPLLSRRDLLFELESCRRQLMILREHTNDQYEMLKQRETRITYLEECLHKLLGGKDCAIGFAEASQILAEARREREKPRIKRQPDEERPSEEWPSEEWPSEEQQVPVKRVKREG